MKQWNTLTGTPNVHGPGAGALRGKRYQTVLLILAVSLAAAFFHGYQNRFYELVGVSDAAAAKDGIYVVENDGEIFNFFHMDHSGEIIGEIVTPKLSDGFWNSYPHLALDDDGSSYVYGTHRSMESNEERSAVYYCDYEKKALVPVWDFPAGNMMQIQIKNGILYTALPQGEDGQKTAFYSIDREENKKLLFLADTPYANMIDIYFGPGQNIYWSDYHGFIYKNGEKLVSGAQNSNRQYNIIFQEDGIIFSDCKDRTVKKIVFESNDIRTLYGMSDISTFYESLDDSDIVPLQYTDQGSFLATMDMDDGHRILSAFDQDGKEIVQWTRLNYPFRELLNQGMAVFVKVSLMLFFVWMLLFLGLKFTHGTIPLLAKLAAGVVPVIVIFGYVLEIQIGDSMQNRMKEMEYNLLYALADVKLSHMNPELFKRMDMSAIPNEPNYKLLMPEEDYSVLEGVLHHENGGEDKDVVVRTFQWIYIMDEGFLRYVEMDDSSYGTHVYGTRLDDFRSRGQVLSMENAMKEKVIIRTQYNDKEGNWISVFVPIVDEAGVSIGVMESGMSIGTILYETQLLMTEIKLRILFIMLLLGIILIAILTLSLGRIRRLQNAVGRLAAGYLGEEVQVQGRDEIAGITRAFNQMSLRLKEHVDFIRQCSDAYARFVPEKIFDILKRKDVTCVQLGDYQEINAGMLLIHENNFRERFRNMDGESLFSMINRMMDEMVPLVTAEGGIVEEMKESGLTGFFVEGSERALESALAIVETFERLREKGESIPDFRAAVTYGRIRLGVVGHDERIEASTVTELASLSEFLVGIAEKYGARILITARGLEQVHDYGNRYHSRLIGYIYMENLEMLEGIYDVYDGDARTQKKLKLETRELFEAALNDYLSGEYYEARQKFASILRVNGGDRAAKEYIYRCDNYYQTKDRDGTETYMEIY